MKYRVCPYCGANLDHGEKCNCQEEAQEAERVAKRAAKIDALRKSLQRHTQDKNRDRERDAQLAILRAQLQTTTAIKSA